MDSNRVERIKLLLPRVFLYLHPRLTLLSQWVMERTHHAVDSEEYSLNEPLTDHRGSHEDGDISNFTRVEGIHLASIAEKKRLWLRNAILNALFIASWSVNNLRQTLFNLHIIMQVFLCNSALCLQ